MKAMSILWMMAAVSLWWAAVVGATAGMVGCHRPHAVEVADEPPPPTSATTGTIADKSSPTAPKSRPSNQTREAPPENPGDYQEFVQTLKKTVPINMKDFASPRVAMPPGVVVDDYTPCPRHDGLVNRVQLRIEPGVWLKDTITGKTMKYTRVVMVRNNPAPSRYPEPFAWIVVNLLP